jgi:hypothetical protein
MIVVFVGATNISGEINFSKPPIAKHLFFAIIPALILNLSWNLYKAHEIQAVTRIHPDPAFVTDHVGDSNIIESIYLMPANISGILGFGFEKVSPQNEIQSLPSASHYYFAFGNNYGGLGCSKFDQGPEKALELLRLNLSEFDKCNHNANLENFQKITKTVEPLFPLIFFSTLIATIYSIGKIKFTNVQMAIFPLSSLIPYLFEPTITSRYGLPFFFVAPFLLSMIAKNNK